MTLRRGTSAQPLRRFPLGIRPLRARVRLVALTLAAAAACEPGRVPINGSGNGNGNGNGDGAPTSTVAVAAAVTDVGPTGFTLTLQPGVPDMLPENLTLTPTAAVARVTENTGTSNTSYAVETTWLTFGQTYALSITKAGYRVTTTPRFMRSGALSSEATIQKMTLTVHGAEVEGTITDTAIHFPYAPRSTDGPTLTGTVSLELSGGAVVDGASPADGTEKTYTTTPTNITVRAEDDTTTKTYTVATAAYHEETNPYGVYTVEALHAVRDGLADSYRLMQDLTLPDGGTDCEVNFAGQTDYCEAGFSPIGTYTSSGVNDAPFLGTFDGNGHAIKNLFIRRNDDDSIGLFRYMDTPGEIRSLAVVSVNVHGKEFVGGLLGSMKDGTISNCSAAGDVSGNTHVGGLVGYVEVGAVVNSHATAVVSGDQFLGGLIGALANASVSSCYAAGATSGRSDVGGFVGQMTGGNVSSCYAATTATGSEYVGGLVGFMNKGIVTNAYAVGTALGSSKAGGLVGYMGSGTIHNAYATGAVLEGSNVGGFVGSSSGFDKLLRIAHSYYPAGRPTGAGKGTALTAGSLAQASFEGFTFADENAAWKWVEGKWPQLKNIGDGQTTPSLTAHSATVTTTSTTGFALTLAPPLDGLTKDAWALYAGSTDVTLTSVATADSGGTYTLVVEKLDVGTRYNLLYTKPDVIVVPSSAGHITFTVSESTAP